MTGFRVIESLAAVAVMLLMSLIICILEGDDERSDSEEGRRETTVDPGTPADHLGHSGREGVWDGQV